MKERTNRRDNHDEVWGRHGPYTSNKITGRSEKETHEYRSINYNNYNNYNDNNDNNINFRVMSMVTSYNAATSGLVLEPLGSIQVDCDYSRPACLQIGSETSYSRRLSRLGRIPREETEDGHSGSQGKYPATSRWPSNDETAQGW